MISAIALLATSAPPEYHYTFERTIEAPRVELTSATPQATFLVTARATGLGPDGSPTTQNAHVEVGGAITATGVSGNGTLLNVSVDGNAGLNAGASFHVAHAPAFEGDCSTPTDCEATFLVDLRRTDGGESGGSLSVDWSLSFSASVDKPDEPDEGPLELPWTVEIVRQ